MTARDRGGVYICGARRSKSEAWIHTQIICQRVPIFKLLELNVYRGQKMDNFALFQRIEHVKEIMDNVMDLLPERLPHDLSRITPCKSEMENLREIYHDRIISDPRVHMQQKKFDVATP